MNLWQLLISAMRARVLPLYTRLRMILSPGYLRMQLAVWIRTFLAKVFDIRPKDKDDYYPVGWWLVSKRLAYAAVIVIGLVCCIYIYYSRTALLPGRGEAGIKTYHYNSVLLKFAKGRVRILARDGHLAYDGDVQKAACKGAGMLYNKKGVMVYDGNFEDSKYEGDGTRYYGNGSMLYTGNFHENLFEGKGKLFRSNGSLEYEGDFARNKKEGEGTLYNPSSEEVFTGQFANNDIVYASFLGKSTEEMAKCYSGKRQLYSADGEQVRMMDSIHAMTGEVAESDSIDEGATVRSVYVDADYIAVGREVCRTFDELASSFGSPTYVGESFATLPELLMINRLNDESEINILGGSANITTNDVYKEYIEVTDYDTQYMVYLHSYEKDGLIYNFVSDESDDTFAFYYILAKEEE